MHSRHHCLTRAPVRELFQIHNIININCRRLSFISRPRLNVNTNCGVPSCHGYTVQAIGCHLTTEETMICTVSCIQIEHNYCRLRESQQFANIFTKELCCNLRREAFFPPSDMMHDSQKSLMAVDVMLCVCSWCTQFVGKQTVSTPKCSGRQSDSSQLVVWLVADSETRGIFSTASTNGKKDSRTSARFKMKRRQD